MTEAPGFLLIISGPSGAGKSTVLRAVMQYRSDMFFSVSATTRPPRQGERHGQDYYFLSREEFLRMRGEGGLLEWAEYAGHYYGTPLAPVTERIQSGHIVVLDIETMGAMTVMEKCTGTVSIFLTPSSLHEVERRLRDRGTESEEKIRRRMEITRESYIYIDRYDYIVINDTLKMSTAQLEAILLAEQSRASRLPDLFTEYRRNP